MRKNKLAEQTEGNEPEHIFNVDETGLFNTCISDKSLTLKEDKCCDGKSRIIKFKLKPLAIGKHQKPHCIKKFQLFTKSVHVKQ